MIFRRSFLILLACFFLSGFAGLVYQTAWLLEFSLVFGASELALVTVLAAYMAGLASGAGLIGRMLHRVRHPLMVYGLLELGIAISALAVPLAIKVAAGLHGAWFGGGVLSLNGETFASGLFYLLSSFFILWIPTALMGATLPLLAQWAIRDDSEMGVKVGLLYGFNTAGAAAGTGLAAFGLLPHLGMGLTIWVAVAANALVFALALLLARGGRTGGASDIAVPSAQSSRLPKRHWILPAVLVSGMVSFTWEIVWTRLLSHLFGSSVYAFATMLATFLIGLALGSGLGARFATTNKQARHYFAVSQLAIAAGSIAAFALVERTVVLVETADQESALTRGALVIFLLLIPSAMAIGASFPFAVRVYAQNHRQIGPASARIFAWNTLGAITGVITTGYWVLPSLKFVGTAVLAAITSAVLAFMVGVVTRPRKPALAILSVALVIGIGLFPPDVPWRVLQHSPLVGEANSGSDSVVYYGVGRSSTVLVTEHPNFWRITTDGLPESAIDREWGRSNRYVVARWLSLLPLAVRPEAESMLIIGYGAGVTVERIPQSVKDIHVVEIEPEVIRANQIVKNRPFQPLNDPRVKVHINDARGALRLASQKFNAVVSQPSHPWTSGAANLFTYEFFELVKHHLHENGVFVQWMGLSFIDGTLLETLVATAKQAFNHVELYRPSPGVVLVVSSQTPLDLEHNMRQSLAQFASYWQELGVFSTEDMLAARALDDRGATAFSKNGLMSTDYANAFRYGSPRALHNPVLADGAQELFAPFEPLLDLIQGEHSLYLVRRLVHQGELQRAEALANSIQSLANRETATSYCQLAHGRPKQAELGFSKVIKTEQNHFEARAGLLLAFQSRLSRGRPAPRHLLPLDEKEQRMVDCWRYLALGDWTSLRRLDPFLATIRPTDPFWIEARRLRVRWRIQSNLEEYGNEGLDLLYPLLAPVARPQDLMLRARAGLVGKKPRLALASLQEVLDGTRQSYLLQRFAREVVAVLNQVEDHRETDSWRQDLMAQARELLQHSQQTVE